MVMCTVEDIKDRESVVCADMAASVDNQGSLLQPCCTE